MKRCAAPPIETEAPIFLPVVVYCRSARLLALVGREPGITFVSGTVVGLPRGLDQVAGSAVISARKQLKLHVGEAVGAEPPQGVKEN